AVETAGAAVRHVGPQIDLAARHLVAVAVVESFEARQHAPARPTRGRLRVEPLDAGVAALPAVAEIHGQVDALAAALLLPAGADAGALVAELALEAGVAARAAMLGARAGVHAGAVAGLEPAVADAFALDAALPVEAGIAAAPAVGGIGGGVHADLVAGEQVLRAIEDAEALLAGAVLAADDPA